MHISRWLLRGSFAVAMLGLALRAPVSAGVLYDQQFDQSGNAYASQDDTTGGNGNYATMYDNFTLGSSAIIDTVSWVGEYFNPASPSPISGWTVNFYSDSGGQPGALLSTTSFAGNGNELSQGSYAGYPTYSYSLSSQFLSASAGTQYWLSVIPDVGFPPQWGWTTATGGDASSFQDFFGSRSAIAADMAFTLSGGPAAVPEPSALLLAIMGLGGLYPMLAYRRKQAVEHSIAR